MTRKPKDTQAKTEPRRGRGFSSVSGFIQRDVRKAGEQRGFAVMRLLTHWQEIVGEDLAKMAQPVKVGYGREGFGATLTVLTSGPNAPILQTQLPKIRERVNACYGYSAISRVRITQTAPVGFGETSPAFSGPEAKKAVEVLPEIREASTKAAENVGDARLRSALETLGQNVLSRRKNAKG
ncbi:MAG: DUF721 domain-containing protein [Paracoccaceae bacterium]